MLISTRSISFFVVAPVIVMLLGGTMAMGQGCREINGRLYWSWEWAPAPPPPPPPPPPDDPPSYDDIEVCPAHSGGTAIFRIGPVYLHPAAKGLHSLAAPVVAPYGTGSEPVAFADLNRDGNPDVVQVATNSNGGTVTVQLLDGAGNVISTSHSAIGSTSINHIVVADLNGDGTFQIPMALVGVQYPGSPVAANFYGTGRADIAVMDIVANTCWFFRRSRMAHSRRHRVFQADVDLDI